MRVVRSWFLFDSKQTKRQRVSTKHHRWRKLSGSGFTFVWIKPFACPCRKFHTDVLEEFTVLKNTSAGKLCSFPSYPEGVTPFTLLPTSPIFLIPLNYLFPPVFGRKPGPCINSGDADRPSLCRAQDIRSVNPNFNPKNSTLEISTIIPSLCSHYL